MHPFASHAAGARSRECRAFTLVEFILVMGLLATVMAVAAPSLSKFFKGRKLDSEARRFVSLARYGQNLAVNEGMPMMLWIDPDLGTYGVRPQDQYLFEQLPSESLLLRRSRGAEPVSVTLPQFRLADELKFDVEILGKTNTQFVMIRLMPDGTIDEGSLPVLQIQQPDREGKQIVDKIWIAQSRDQSRYEIVQESNALERISPDAQSPRGIYIR